MKKYSRLATLTIATALSTGLMAVSSVGELRAQGARPNPCAPKAANPCAPKAANPCAPKAANPCAAKGASAPDIDPKRVVRPKGTKLLQGNKAELVKLGKTLFSDAKLSTNGVSCQSCHANNENFAPGFAKAYPHPVDMAKERGGLSKINLDEMIQFCLIVPMEAKTLPWNSKELAALAAYTGELQNEFRKNPPAAGAKSANPCAAKNPCAPRNPCAAKNPCAPKK